MTNSLQLLASWFLPEIKFLRVKIIIGHNSVYCSQVSLIITL